MNVPHLSVVRSEDLSESPAVRARRLFSEARGAALEQVRLLESEIVRTLALAEEVAAGGDIYPAGVRDLCARLSEDLGQRAQTLEVLAQRVFEGS